MIHAVVITHGRLGEELLNSAEGVRANKRIDSVGLLKEDNPGSFEEKICKVLKKEEEQLLFLADIYGGNSLQCSSFPFEKVQCLDCDRC